MHRPFRTPFVPLFPILGVVICGGMIVALDVMQDNAVRKVEVKSINRLQHLKLNSSF